MSETNENPVRFEDGEIQLQNIAVRFRHDRHIRASQLFITAEPVQRDASFMGPGGADYYRGVIVWIPVASDGVEQPPALQVSRRRALPGWEDRLASDLYEDAFRPAGLPADSPRVESVLSAHVASLEGILAQALPAALRPSEPAADAATLGVRMLERERLHGQERDKLTDALWTAQKAAAAAETSSTRKNAGIRLTYDRLQELKPIIRAAKEAQSATTLAGRFEEMERILAAMEETLEGF